LSTVTVALMPERSGGSSAPCGNVIRTATRCTTFTQLPVAFCAGSNA
jgi:hypothetical protein